jgi:hypothetical protein
MLNIIPEKIKNFFFKDKNDKDKNPFNSLFYIIIFIIIIINIVIYFNSIMYINVIIILIILFSYFISSNNKKKDKSFAMLLSLIPIIPANRIYINNLDIDSILIRLVPIIGNIYDIYYTFYKKTLIPKDGWVTI